MIFDDHDVHDDWNISEAWVAEMRAKPWWEERIVGASCRTGSTSTSATSRPSASTTTTMLDAVRAAPTTARRLAARVRPARRPRDRGQPLELLPRLRRRAARRPRLPRGPRARRGPPRDGRRRRVGVDLRAARGRPRPPLVATSLPLLLAPGLHHLEAWNEAVCDGAWGGSAARAGRAACAGPRPRALGGVRRVLRAADDAPARGRRGPRAGRRRRRSSCCRATSTTPTSPRSASGREASQRRLAGGLLAAPQPARRARAARDPLGGSRPVTPSAARSRGPPACPTRTCGGAWSKARSSTTRSRPWSSTAGRGPHGRADAPGRRRGRQRHAAQLERAFSHPLA